MVHRGGEEDACFIPKFRPFETSVCCEHFITQVTEAQSQGHLREVTEAQSHGNLRATAGCASWARASDELTQLPMLSA